MTRVIDDRETCYRHPGRETGVHCSSCGKPICPDCMTSTPVGMRCPDCSKQKTKVRTPRSFDTSGALPLVTQAIIGICVLVWFGELATENQNVDSLLFRGGLNAGAIDVLGEWWRVVTAGFLHSDDMPIGIMHIGFNMYLLAFLGKEFEPQLGPVRFAVAFLTCLVGGSLGALIVSPDSITVGASGAVFGLMGIAVVDLRGRGIPLMQSQIGGTLVLNLILTFALVNYISVGGHIGGLVTGCAVGWLMLELGRRHRDRRHLITAGCGVLAVALFAAAILVAQHPIT